MKTLNVALLQLRPRTHADASATAEASLDAGLRACEQAAAMGADIALFPEMWNLGYALPESEADVPHWQAQAVDADGDHVGVFRQLARRLKLAIGLTFLERHEPQPRNSFLLIGADGATVLHYAKVHTCDFGPERWCTPGDGFRVATLDTRIGPVKVGAMTCFDREFPESARSLMLQGAELILVPNACEIEANRRAQLQARAFENMVGVALANYADSPAGNGHSLAFDGMAFGPDGRSRDMLLVEAGEDEGVFLAHFDIERLRRYRESEVWGNAYRRVRAYAALTEAAVAPPFLRTDSREPSA